MSKREYCEKRDTIAYCGECDGLEIKGIEYGIIDMVYCVSGVWRGEKAFHRCKIYYPITGSAFFRVYGRKIRFDECIETGAYA